MHQAKDVDSERRTKPNLSGSLRKEREEPMN
jgi:hypothetical protein